MAYISLGIILSVATMTVLPQTIKSVTAQLSTPTVLPLQEINEYGKKLPKYEKIKTTPVSYALPAINIYQNNGQPTQMDMNGDGLLDIVFANAGYDSSYGSGLVGTQYVLLNTGSGFEISYFCKKDFKTKWMGTHAELDFTYYQGECADTNSIRYPN
jgi:hypothetical protein